MTMWDRQQKIRKSRTLTISNYNVFDIQGNVNPSKKKGSENTPDNTN